MSKKAKRPLRAERERRAKLTPFQRFCEDLDASEKRSEAEDRDTRRAAKAKEESDELKQP